MLRFLFVCICSVLIGSGSIVCGQIHHADHDSVKRWKQESEWFYNNGRLKQAHEKFIQLASFYFNSNDTVRGLDYLNKGFNCTAKVDSVRSIRDFYEILSLLQYSTVKDTILLKAIFDSFENNYKNLGAPTNIFALIDALITIVNEKPYYSLQKRIYQFRIKIAEENNQLQTIINSYYRLIQIDSSDIFRLNNLKDLSQVYQKNNDYSFSNVILFYILNSYKLNDNEKSIIYNLIGNNFIYLKLPELSFPFYDTSRHLRELNGSLEDLRVIYNNFGNYYKLVNHSDSALIYYKKALNIALTRFGTNSRECAFEYNNIGNYYYNLGIVDSALFNYSKSLQINSINTDNYIEDIVHSSYNVGLCYFNNKDYYKSLHYMFNSILFNKNSYPDKRKQYNSFSIKDMIFSYEIIGDIYVEKSLEDSLNQTLYLDSARYYYTLSINYADSLISYSPFEFTQLQINESYYRIIHKTIRCHISAVGKAEYTRQDFIQLAALFDRSHNFILSNRVQLSTIPGFADNINTFTKSSKLFSILKILERQQPFPLDSIIKVSSTVFVDLLNQETTPYQEHIWQFNSISINDLENYMKSITSKIIILEYTIINDSLFSLIINNNNINIANIGEADGIIKIIDYCRNNIKKLEKDDIALSYLSKTLLSQIRMVPETNSDLIIIPDVSLQGFPFEILYLDAYDDNQPELLISRFNVIYAPSIAELSLNTSSDEKTFKYDFIGFAPGFFYKNSNNLLSDLPLSMIEVKRISELLKKNNYQCLTFTGPLASISNLQNYANQTRILHIATHTEISTSFESSLLFYQPHSGNNLSNIDYFDITSLKNSPEIVVLSSCNTYQGTKYNGEGIINLVRAFLLNGTSYIIYSLFNTEDYFANEFMFKLYSRFIESGNIALSLNETKREFLSHPLYSNPVFWANFNIIKR